MIISLVLLPNSINNHSLNLLETLCKKVTACETTELDKYTVVYLTLRVI